ncbi:MAG: HDOD domain-containing protein [Oligoflexales bacterium]
MDQTNEFADPSSQVASKTCKVCARNYFTPADYMENGRSWRICTVGYLWFECQCGSTLALKKGSYSWYSPKLSLEPTSIPIFEDSEAMSKIPQLPGGLMKLQQQIRNPQVSSNQIAGILRKTPVLATEVLSMANNIKTAQGAIKKLEHAVSYLGRPTICNLALTATLQSFKFNCKHYKLHDFWQEAILTGLISEVVCLRYAKNPEVDLAYLSGCLCNIGKLVGALCYEKETDAIFELLSNRKTMTTWIKAEEQINAKSHLNLGDIAAVSWGLPAEIRQSILLHHKPFHRVRKDPTFLRPYECVGFACMLAHWVNLTPHRIDKERFVSYQIYLGMSDREMDKFVSSLLPLREAVESQIEASKIIN